jgi:beta-mannosidase
MNILHKVENIPLNGNWRIKNSKKSIEINVSVPRTVFEALLENNNIEDPFYGENEDEMKWVYESDWFYELEFDVEHDFLEHKKVLLCFKGLDTIAEVNLNGENLGFTNNMFVRYDFSVKDKLKITGNKLIIKFMSPTMKAKEEMKKFGVLLNTGYAAIPGVPYLRKAQYSFGWDWGPKLPDIGIWKSAELIGYDDIRIMSIYPSTKFEYNKDPLKINSSEEISTLKVNRVKLFVEIEFDSDLEDISGLNCQIKVKLTAPDNIVLVKEFFPNNKKEIIKFKIEKPFLWWTHDLGKPNLYEIEVSLLKDSIIDIKKQKIGLRDIRLIQQPDQWGESFYFMINGIPLFAKGANWIPIDSFIPRGKELGLYSMNLNYAKEANMNMIRVWGGGIYEDDLFYDFCDELGILVWQDFPFACAIYPYYKEFIKNIEEEAIQNIKRLRHHPSLALWCGNNEIEWLWNWEINSSEITDKPTSDEFKQGYITIFEKILPKIIEEIDPHRSYWPSSPSNGFIGEKLGSVNSNSPNFGDSHFWEVWHRNKPFSAYRKLYSRFMSEFGYESFPSLKTLAAFCPPEQFDFFAPIMENHQKNSAGNKKIMDYMEKRFTKPSKFENQVILSQITQAEAIEYGVEHWRRNRNQTQCMGSLYWQLNDCWPVASWSSIDYYGRWKALHYFAQRFYKPLFASVKEDTDQIEFWVTNDFKDPQSIKFYWKILKSDGINLMKGEYESLVSPCSSLKLGVVDVSNINTTKKLRQNNVIFYRMENANKLAENVTHGFRLFDAPKYFNLKDPEITSSLEQLNDDKENVHFKLIVEAKRIALYVIIYSDLVDFIASDNFFSLEPNEIRIIDIKIVNLQQSKLIYSMQNIYDSFKVTSLYDLTKCFENRNQ